MRRSVLLAAGALGAGIAAIALTRRRQADIRGNVVLITGGSRGLGLALAREFAGHGCRVAICARDAEELAAASVRIEGDGRNVFTAVCDVSDKNQVDEMVAQVQAHYGDIDILVNNAGQMLVAPFENTTIDDFRKAMDVMFWGGLYPSLAVLPRMLERGRGRIAGITSIGGKVSVPHMLPYCCAKFAAVAFFEGLSAELAGSGVSVTTIVPGLMRTGSHVNARFRGDHQNEAAWFSAAASLPVLAMGAERAARQVVCAIRQQRAERVLTPQARLLVRLQGSFPGLLPHVFGIVNRLLPNSASGAPGDRRGMDLQHEQSGLLKFVTALGREAGLRLNQGIT